MIEIKDKQSLEKAYDAIMKDLLAGKTIHFCITFVESKTGDIHWCHGSLVSELPEEGKRITFVDDWRKFLIVLLSHERIKDIVYDEEEHLVGCFFEPPDEYAEEEEWEEEP